MNDSTPPLWPAPWIRAALGTAVLATLEDGPLHGYGIAAALQERGFGRPKGGSLYPLLTTLEENGTLSAVWEQGESGPGRRTYHLTETGRERLSSERRDWHLLAEALGPSATASNEKSEQ